MAYIISKLSIRIDLRKFLVTLLLAKSIFKGEALPSGVHTFLESTLMPWKYQKDRGK